MQVSNTNDVKIYNLSAGKSLPEVSNLLKDCVERGYDFVYIWSSIPFSTNLINLINNKHSFFSG